MCERILILLIGLSLGFAVGVAVEGKLTNMDYAIVQKKCLWPVTNGTFVAEPYSKTCFSIEGDVKKPVDCNTVLTIKQFQIVKHCF